MGIADLFEFKVRPSTPKEWKEVAEEIYEKVAEALDNWCWNISGDTALECYSSHMDKDLYELAEEFVGWSVHGVTEEDLELLREMPDDIYNEYSEKLQSSVERVVRKLEKEFGGEEEAW